MVEFLEQHGAEIVSIIIALAGLILYSFVAFFQIITLPVEFDASNRALKTIKANNFLIDEEYSGAKKVLTAAALTYVASVLTSILQIIRLLGMVNRRD